MTTAERDIKGKGKAIADYESVTSSTPRFSPAPSSRMAAKGFGKSPMSVDDDDIFASHRFPGSVIAAAPSPMSNLWRPSSAPLKFPPPPVRSGNAFHSIIRECGCRCWEPGHGDGCFFLGWFVVCD